LAESGDYRYGLGELSRGDLRILLRYDFHSYGEFQGWTGIDKVWVGDAYHNPDVEDDLY
jgi:hypothetical protein